MHLILLKTKHFTNNVNESEVKKRHCKYTYVCLPENVCFSCLYLSCRSLNWTTPAAGQPPSAGGSFSGRLTAASSSRLLYSMTRSTEVMRFSTSADCLTPHCSMPVSVMQEDIARPTSPPVISDNDNVCQVRRE